MLKLVLVDVKMDDMPDADNTIAHYLFNLYEYDAVMKKILKTYFI
ncbi:MAG: hypothetical protein PHV95_05425 [Eubacteriales bacterium]|nr:hypothetical protein [Eubacteriales bacterium]